MSRDQIIEFVGQYGFILWATERSEGKGMYHFMEKRLGINLWVNERNLDFRFEWVIPHAMSCVRSGLCSPLSNREHFEKMLRRFERPVEVLYGYSQAENDKEDVDGNK